MPKTIGIIMTYNCAHLLEDTWRHIPKQALDKIIVVDDGSIDESVEIAKRLGIRVFSHKHLGYGGNLRFGLCKSMELGAYYMVEIHGDDQFDLSIIPQALEKMRAGYDFIIGSRFTNWRQPLRDGMSLSRYLANIGLSAIERMVLRLPFSEFHPGFRVYSRRFIQAIDLKNGASDYLYSFEIIALAAYHRMRCAEIPNRADYKKEHTSVSALRAAKNSFEEMYILFLYILARIGIKTKLFN